MKKTILGIAIGVSLCLGVYALATPTEVRYVVDNGIEFLRGKFEAGYSFIESFKDNKTGVICYVVDYYNSRAISCVK